MSLRNRIYHLLRKGEAVTGTDNVYLAKGGFWLSLVQALASASSLLLSILFAHFVPKASYGTYQYLLAWGSVFSIVSLTGMSDALIQAVASGHDRAIYRVLKLRFASSLIGLLAGALVGGWYFWHGNTTFGLGFLILGAFFPVMSSVASGSDYLVGKKQFQFQARIMMASTLVAGAAMALTILFFPYPLAFLGAFCLVWTLAHGLGLLYILKRVPPKGDDDPSVIAYGLKLSAFDILNGLAGYFDRLVVFMLLGAASTAAYVFAIAPPEQLKGYLKNLYFIALPKISSRPIADIRKTFFKKFWLMSGIVALGIIVYVLLAPFVYRLLFPAYPEAIRLSQVYAIGLIGTASVLTVALFTGHKRTKENLGLQVSISVFGILALLILVPRWGLMGAVTARVVTRLFGMVVGILLAQKVFMEDAAVE